MSIKSSYKVSIPDLTVGNYQIWRRATEAQLGAFDGLDIVLGTELPPAPGATAAAILAAKEYRLRSGKAYALLFGTCSAGGRSAISKTKSPSEIWEILKAKYDSVNSQAAQQATITKFTEVRPDLLDVSIDDYVTRLSNLRDKLIGSPAEIDDRTFINQLLR